MTVEDEKEDGQEKVWKSADTFTSGEFVDPVNLTSGGAEMYMW